MNISTEKKIINFESGIERFAGNKELYIKYICKFHEQNDFNAFCDDMSSENYDEAFKKSHSLKGVVGNLSFDRLFDSICCVTEMLRNGKDIAGAIAALPDLQSEYDILMQELENIA